MKPAAFRASRRFPRRRAPFVVMDWRHLRIHPRTRPVRQHHRGSTYSVDIPLCDPEPTGLVARIIVHPTEDEFAAAVVADYNAAGWDHPGDHGIGRPWEIDDVDPERFAAATISHPDGTPDIEHLHFIAGTVCDSALVHELTHACLDAVRRPCDYRDRKITLDSEDERLPHMIGAAMSDAADLLRRAGVYDNRFLIPANEKGPWHDRRTRA